MKAFMKNADDTLKELGVDKERGLSDAQVEESRRKYGFSPMAVRTSV